MIKRTRSRTNNMRTPSKQSNPGIITSADDRNELRLKNRNHYQQMLDKYSTMARESLRSGDRIEAEVHYQYAEHYLRQLNERIKHDTEAQQSHNQKQQHREQERLKHKPQNQTAQDNTQTHDSDEQSQDQSSVRTHDSSASNTSSDNNGESADDNTENPSKTPVRRRGPRTFYKRTRTDDNTTTPQDTPAQS